MSTYVPSLNWVLLFFLFNLHNKIIKDWVKGRQRYKNWVIPLKTVRNHKPYDPNIWVAQYLWDRPSWNWSFWPCPRIHRPVSYFSQFMRLISCIWHVRKWKCSSWRIDGKKLETVADFICLGSKITSDGDCSHKLKDAFSLEEKLWQTWTAYEITETSLCQQRSI